MDAVFRSDPPEPCPAPFNLADHVLRHSVRLSEKAALVEIGGDTWSYGGLRRAVLGTAAGLLEHAHPGQRVLLRLGDTVDFPIAFLGAIAAGLVPVPTSAQLTETEISLLPKALGPALVITVPGLAAPKGHTPRLGLDALRAMRARPPVDPALGDPDRPAFIVFTSGTAAGPRGVIHAHRAVWARRMMIADWEGLRETDRLLHAGAFNWTYTLGTGLLDPWAMGATALIPGRSAAPEDLADHLAEQRATIFAAVPGVYRRMLRSAPPPLPWLRHGLSAGEKLPETLRQDWRKATGTDIHEAYGQSECSTFISGSPFMPAPPGTLGRPQRGRRVAVLDTDGTPVAIGMPGRLAVAAEDPGLMLSYLDGPDENACGAWRTTGDVAAMDEDGWIVYLGRDDDVMTAGGYRVSPLEVEAAAVEVAGVEEAAAFEREVRPGLRVIALAYCAATDLDAEIATHLAERLARYKRPRIVERRADLPKNRNGKLQRRALREEPRP